MVIKNFFARLSNIFKSITEDPVDRLCEVISATGQCFWGLGINSAIVLFLLGGSYIPHKMIFLPAIWYFIALIIQSFTLAAAGKKRVQDNSWEGSSHYFSLPHALPVIIICSIGIILSQSLWYEYFRRLMLDGLLSSFDEYSLQPLVCTVISFIMAALGIRSAFIPYSQMMSVKRVITSTCIYFLCFLTITVSVAEEIARQFGIYLGIFFICYIVCAAIILNQNVIVRKSNAPTVSKIGKYARIYDMKITLLWLIGSALLGGIAFFVIGGIWYILKFIFFLIVWNALKSTKSYERPERLESADISDAVFEGNELLGSSMVIGAIYIVISIIFIIVLMRSGRLSLFIETIKEWFESLISLFMRREPYLPENEINYKDELEIMTAPKSSINTQLITNSSSINLRAFKSELSARKNNKDKLTYSYMVMISLLREINPSLEASDTPRELSAKIASSISITDIDEITYAVELAAYAEKLESDDTISKALSAVCDVIVKRLR